MANRAYNTFLQSLIDLDGKELRAALIDTGVYTADTTDGGDEYVADLNAAAILGEKILENISFVNRILDADNIVNDFPDHGGGVTGEALAIYDSTIKAENAITGGVAGTNLIYVADDQTEDIRVGQIFEVENSDELDGFYNVKSVTYNAGNSRTEVEVYEDLSGIGTFDGDLVSPDASNARLWFFLDNVTGLPVILDGNDDSITWHSNGIWIMT